MDANTKTEQVIFQKVYGTWHDTAQTHSIMSTGSVNVRTQRRRTAEAQLQMAGANRRPVK